MWIKVLVPAGIALAIAVGGGAYTRSLENEHRLTTVEVGFANLEGRQERMDTKIDHVTEALGRIEGTLGTKPGP